MHAKLEVFGIATMLKIMFTHSTEELRKILNRNELVAFINLFAKLSKSIDNIDVINLGIKKAHYNLRIKKIKYICSVFMVGIILSILLFNFIKRKEDEKNEKLKKKNI